MNMDKITMIKLGIGALAAIVVIGGFVMVRANIMSDEKKKAVVSMAATLIGCVIAACAMVFVFKYDYDRSLKNIELTSANSRKNIKDRLKADNQDDSENVPETTTEFESETENVGEMESPQSTSTLFDNEVDRYNMGGNYGGTFGQSDYSISIYTAAMGSPDVGNISLYIDSENPKYGGMTIEGELIRIAKNKYCISGDNVVTVILDFSEDNERIDDDGVPYYQFNLSIDGEFVEYFMMLNRFRS